jgi:hypothetical protein
VSESVTDTIALAREQEQLRQERETFDQRKKQDGRWFLLRLAMGWTAVALLPGIGVTSGWIIFHYAQFAASTVTVATGALLVDTLGLVLSVWRIVLGRGPESLGPVTATQPRRSRHQ